MNQREVLLKTGTPKRMERALRRACSRSDELIRAETDAERQRLGRDEVNQLTEACSKNPDGKIKLVRELSTKVS
jgi:hypothetical protein